MNNQSHLVSEDGSLIRSMRNSLLTCIVISVVYLAANIWLADSVIQLVKSAANPFFAAFILFATIFGQALTLYHAVKITREIDLTQRIKNALALRREESQELRIETLEQVLTESPSELAAWRLFSKLGEDEGRVSGSTQTAVREQMQTFEAAILRRANLPQHIANTLIGLGLFGTFLGLIVTLKSVAALIGVFAVTGNVESADVMGQFFQRMSGPLAGMGEAFVASLLGLGGSIVNGLQILSFKKLQSNALSVAQANQMEVVQIVYGPLADAVGGQVSLDVRLAQLQLQEVSALRHDISKQTDAILVASSKMRQAADLMGKTLEVLERVATQDMARSNTDSFSAVMDQRLQTVANKLDDLHLLQHGALTVAKESGERIANFNQQTGQLVLHMSNTATEVQALRREQNDTFASVRGQLLEAVDGLKESLHHDVSALTDAMSESVRAEREQVQMLGEIHVQSNQTSRQLQTMSEQAHQMIERVEPKVVEMIARLEKTEQTNEYVAKYDWADLHTKVDQLQASLTDAIETRLVN